MRIINNSRDDIKVGDLIREDSTGNIYYLAYEDHVYVLEDFEQMEREFKYLLINLDRGEVDNSVKDIEFINSNYRLLARNEELELYY